MALIGKRRLLWFECEKVRRLLEGEVYLGPDPYLRKCIRYLMFTDVIMTLLINLKKYFLCYLATSLSKIRGKHVTTTNSKELHPREIHFFNVSSTCLQLAMKRGYIYTCSQAYSLFNWSARETLHWANTCLKSAIKTEEKQRLF